MPAATAPGKARAAAADGASPPRGDAVTRRLHALGLIEPADLILHLPLRYEDETRITPISALRPGFAAQVEGEITRCEVQYRPRRQLTAAIADDSGELQLRWLNFYPSQQRQLTVGRRLRARGEVRGGLFGREMVHPRMSSADAPLATALTPVYPTTEGLHQTVLRKAIAQALAQADLSDTLPPTVRQRYDLAPFDESLRVLHAPPTGVSEHELVERAHPAWRRIKFDELLAQQLSLAAARAARRRTRPCRWRPPTMPAAWSRACMARLPFALTAAQQRVVAEIAADLARPFPMHRLLQGDVGSGKTVVAAIAAAQAMEAGAQVALMAPTEILAEQHFRKLVDWLHPLGVRVAWLSGSVGAKARREAAAAVADGSVQLIVGTQALIQEHVAFQRLGLSIVDEQHRFGVGQRLALNRKGESARGRIVPHQLNMSATPIPRTLAMTFFADLDVSVIDELPPGRTPVVTKLVSDARRDEVIAHIAQAARAGRQAYWVCPLVEESEALELQTAVDTYEAMRADLPDLRIGLVHGRLPQNEKAEVMQAFREGRIDVLVATTVIEVGVDVPNASLMVIEHAGAFRPGPAASVARPRGTGHRRVGLRAAATRRRCRASRANACVRCSRPPTVSKSRGATWCSAGPGNSWEPGNPAWHCCALPISNWMRPSREQAREAAAWLRKDYTDAVQAHLARWMRGREDFLRT